MTVTLPAEEQAEAERTLADLLSNGYKQHDQYKHFTPGARIRHTGQQYMEAYENGTGNIFAVTVRNERDVELVVVYDEPRFPGGSRVTCLANYHVEVIR